MPPCLNIEIKHTRHCYDQPTYHEASDALKQFLELLFCQKLNPEISDESQKRAGVVDLYEGDDAGTNTDGEHLHRPNLGFRMVGAEKNQQRIGDEGQTPFLGLVASAIETKQQKQSYGEARQALAWTAEKRKHSVPYQQSDSQ